MPRAELPDSAAIPGGLALLSILMPCYNERRSVDTIVRRVLSAALPLPMELIIVDDGSTDGSLEVLRDLAAADARVRLIAHDRNAGKGAAIRTAIAAMAGDVAIIQDADLEYDPADIPRVLEPILAGRADAVYGSRFLAGEHRRPAGLRHWLGNRFLTWCVNVLCGLHLTDMETCYKAIRADILRNLTLRSSDFAFEPEVTIRLAQWGARLGEVPVSYTGRTYQEGKKIGWRDGWRALWAMLRFRFFDTRFFSQNR